MKIIILAFLLSYALKVQSATISWIGPAAGNWNNVANWSGSVLPGSMDDVVFSISATIEMDIIPATSPFIYAINSLKLTNNSNVVLSRTQPGGGTRIFQLRNTSAAVPGLDIQAGSTLTLNTANATGTLALVLDMTGGGGVTGQISGGLFFTATGAGTGDGHLNLHTGASNFANLLVKNGGLIKYFTNTGNTAASSAAELTMESGSVYEINKNGGSVPNGNWDDNATILITGAVANGSINFSQYHFGNLEWNTPAMSAVTQLIAPLSPVTAISLHNLKIVNTNTRELRLKTGAGSVSPAYDYTVRGGLTIGTSGTLVLTGNNVVNAGAGSRLHLQGIFLNAGSLRSDGIAGTINELDLNGTSNQTISNKGIFSGAQLKVIVNNPAGISLLTTLQLPGTLSLINGKIKTTTVNVLTMIDNTNYSGGSSLSFVDGPMNKIGDDAFVFPVGKGGIYAPIGFSPEGTLLTSDIFRAEYFRLNPQTLFGTFYETPPIDHVSYVEYWQLEKGTANSLTPVDVMLSVSATSFAKDINTLYVARNNPTTLQWQSAGITARISGPPDPPYSTGSVTSAGVTQPGIFTLAASAPEAINPLPVTLLFFNAKKVSPAKIALTWQVTAANTDSTIFSIETSVNEGAFNVHDIITGDAYTKSFKVILDLEPGMNKFRLKITTPAGISYSNVVALQTDPSDDMRCSVAPNPIHELGQIELTSTFRTSVIFSIVNSQGQLMKQWKETISAGITRSTIDMTSMSAGTYLLVIDNEHWRKRIVVVKQ